MILYLDTSAYIKLFVAESGSDSVRETVEQADVLATHIVAYAEMRAAFASILRSGRLSARETNSVKRRFERHWKKVLRFTPDETAIRRAGNFAERFGLKGYDSVHLACAVSLREQSSMRVQFACFDSPLNKAAVRLGFKVVTSA
ncbi:MAG: type II toxin-antitoxin system VapC family toxin [Pyrinomonadaceae bacterium]